MDLTYIIKKIRRLKQLDKSVVVFLGAGASKSAGIPTSSGIVDYILKDDTLSQFTEEADTKEYFEIMNKFDPGERYRILKKFINEAKINETHLIVGLLISLGYVDCIVTTNFDPLIKRALILLSEDIPVYDVPNNVDFSSKQITYPSIFHLHGELENVWQFNTLEELNKGKDKIQSIIKRVAPKRAWIIVGYSGSDKDPVFNELCNFEKFEEGLFWIGYNEDEPPKHLQKKLLSDATKNAHYINGYDSDIFFKTLFSGLKSELSKEMIKYLETITNSIEQKERLNRVLINDLSEEKTTKFKDELSSKTLITKFEPIRLTTNCKKWIVEKIQTATTKKFEPKPLNIIDKLINYINPTFYYEQKVLNYVKTLLNEDYFKKASDFLSGKIKESEENPFYQYYYGISLGEIAQRIDDPQQRLNEYSQAIKSLNKAKKFFKKLEYKPKELEYIDLVIKTLWSKEHNLAVKYASNDEVKQITTNSLNRSLYHLEIALTIRPNSTLSWAVRAQVNSMKENFSEATKAQERYIELKPNPEIKDYLLLAQYCRKNEQLEKAIEVLEKTQKTFTDKSQVTEILADVYYQAGKDSKSIAAVEKLVAKDPKNAKYRLSLGTRIYQKALDLESAYAKNVEEIKNLQQAHVSNPDKGILQNKINNLKSKNGKIFQNINLIAINSIEQIKNVLEIDPYNHIAYRTLGIIHQNRASILFDKRNITTDPKAANKINENGMDALKEAKKYYMKAVEIDPDNIDYLNSLSTVYKAMGMDKKAEEVLANLKK